MTHLRVGMLAVGLTAGGCTAADPAPGGALVLDHVNVVSMATDQIRTDAVVVVLDGRIVSIGDGGSIRAGDDAVRVDGHGAYLVPGLIDPHVHVRAPEELPLYLGAGVTTVRNMNGNFGDPLTWRSRIESGELVGPRLITAGPTLFDESPDYPWHVPDPDAARAMVRQLQRDGYDLIKVFRLAEPTLLALMEEARAVGMPVAGHYPVPEATLDRILPLGLVSIEHLDELVRPSFGGASDYESIPVAVGAFAESGVAVGTILAQWEAVNRGLDDPNYVLNDSIVESATRYFGADGRTRLQRLAEGFAGRDEASRAADRSDFPFLFALLKALDDAGVPILASTDAHQALAPAGEALHNELDVLVRAGLSPYRALRAATVSPAAALGLERVGTVEEGQLADLILVDRNPLDDLRALRRPRGVVLRGAWLPRAELDGLETTALSR